MNAGYPPRGGRPLPKGLLSMGFPPRKDNRKGPGGVKYLAETELGSVDYKG